MLSQLVRRARRKQVVAVATIAVWCAVALVGAAALASSPGPAREAAASSR